MAASEGPPRRARPLPPRIRACLYDLDDTIVESERINDELFSSLLRGEYGIDLTPAEQDYLYGFAWSGVFDWLRENRGLKRDREAIWARFLEVKRGFLQGRRLRVATGLDRMLALPVPHAIVTGSTREEIRMMLENTRLPAEAFAFILSDEDCDRGKPDPEGYLRALKLLGVTAGEVVVFEDSLPGIQAARSAGIVVAFIAELASRDRAAEADVRFDTFSDAWMAVKERIRAAADPREPAAIQH